MEGGALGPAVADGSGGERVLVAHPIRTGSGAGGIPQERRQVCVRADSRVGQMLAGSGAGSAGAGSGERGKWSNHLKCAVRLAALPPQRASPHRDKSSRGAAISPCGSSPCGIGRFGSSPLGSSPLRSSPRGAGVGVVRPKWNSETPFTMSTKRWLSRPPRLDITTATVLYQRRRRGRALTMPAPTRPVASPSHRPHPPRPSPPPPRPSPPPPRPAACRRAAVGGVDGSGRSFLASAAAATAAGSIGRPPAASSETESS